MNCTESDANFLSLVAHALFLQALFFNSADHLTGTSAES